jgi:hypothetical protein
MQRSPHHGFLADYRTQNTAGSGRIVILDDESEPVIAEKDIVFFFGVMLRYVIFMSPCPSSALP